MTREQFLLDTINYYSKDTSRRSTNGNYCTYSPVNSNSKGDGCAIGRWLSPKLKLKLDSIGNPAVHNQIIFCKLPDWMQEFGVKFLDSVQSLHDTSHCWDNSGLSIQGKKEVNNIIKTYKLNIPLYE